MPHRPERAQIQRWLLCAIACAYSKVFKAHMVLAYYISSVADPRILDNMINDARLASQREDLKPVFGFNSQGLWVRGVGASCYSA